MRQQEPLPRASKRYAISTLVGLGFGLLALGCDAASEYDQEELDVPELADTIPLGGSGGTPATKSSKVNWLTAGKPTQGFSGDFARAQFLMANLADAAYKGGNELRTVVTDLGFTIAKSVVGGNAGLGAGNVDAFAARSSQNDMNVIAIRGTEAVLGDVISDGLLVPTTNVKGWPTAFTLHQGFANYSNKVYSDLRSTVEDSCTGPRKPLWVTGHSPGGAAATIVAYKLRRDGCNVQGVSTFGSPRAGLRDWQDAYQQSGLNPITQRWVNAQDPVTCVPPGGGWRHVGTLNRIGNGVTLGVQESSQICNPEGLLGGLKTAAAVIEFPAAATAAITDWLKGVFEIVLFCSNDTKWDDVITLGSCSVIENGTRVLQSYHMTPQDFLLAVLTGVIKASDHKAVNYIGGMGKVDFPEPPPVKVANIHVVFEGDAAVLQQMMDKTIPIIERQQHSLCVASRAKSGEVFCDFRVADGYTAWIDINTNDMLSLTPPQDFYYGDGLSGTRGCSRVIEFPNGSALISCERLIQGDTTIVVHLYGHGDLQ